MSSFIEEGFSPCQDLQLGSFSKSERTLLSDTATTPHASQSSLDGSLSWDKSGLDVEAQPPFADPQFAPKPAEKNDPGLVRTSSWLVYNPELISVLGYLRWTKRSRRTKELAQQDAMDMHIYHCRLHIYHSPYLNNSGTRPPFHCSRIQLDEHSADTNRALRLCARFCCWSACAGAAL